MSHDCYDAYWGAAASDLFELLDYVFVGDAVKFQDSTFWTLVTVQREIERALGMPPGPVPQHAGGASPLTDEEEALLRGTAQQFLERLYADQFDETKPNIDHKPKKHKSDWMKGAGQPQQVPTDAIVQLCGSNPPPPPPQRPHGLIGKVRSALGT